MSGYRKEWPCCGDETYTEAWEPERCPFCELNDAKDRIAELETELAAAQAPASEEVEPVALRVEWDDGAVDLIEPPMPASYEQPFSVTPLFAHPPAKAPEGWKLVPLEITAGQLTAAWHNHALNIEEAEIIYQSLLVNAPQAPATPTPATTPEAEWVKIEDRYPPITGWYCVALADPNDIGWSTSVSWVAFWNGDDFEECDPVEDGQPVTHWCELPAPPQEQ